MLCPDRRLDAEATAAFYGRLGMFASLPEAPAAGLPRQYASATRTTSSPARTSMRSVLPMAKPSCSSQRPRRRSA
ncbi:hypothetical protein A989_07829 [Xanthomonas translucens DAR61454]|nr:hypothetical protein A989_07829 [Xanthomonas translucens DAR61454]